MGKRHRILPFFLNINVYWIAVWFGPTKDFRAYMDLTEKPGVSTKKKYVHTNQIMTPSRPFKD